MSLLRPLAAVLALLAAPGLAHAAGVQPAGEIFAARSPLFEHAPPFDRIQDADFLPALRRGMALQRSEIRRIADRPSRATFQNTIEALERSGRRLERANAVFQLLTGANSNPTLDRIDGEVAPELAAHHDAIFLDPRLFARVEAVYRRRARLPSAEARQLTKVYYEEFVRSGARLPPERQRELAQVNQDLSRLSARFQQSLVAAANAAAFVVDDASRLEGLPPAQVEAAARAAAARGKPGKWLFPLQNTTQQPALKDLADRATRQALYQQSWTRAERGDANDTREVIARMAQLRARKAALLGFPNFAAYALQGEMAETPQAAQALLDALAPAARRGVAAERRAAQAAIAAGGETFSLEAWDWDRYAERVRKARYDVSDAETRPYFVMDRVVEDGLFYAATQLYGITFRPRPDLPVWHPDVKAFEVRDGDGKVLGLVYFDLFRRDNKRGGAWEGSLVRQSRLLGDGAVVYVVTNFPRPAPGEPPLMTYDQVKGLFHEFGHALHALLAEQAYPKLSGTSVARDFVEFPSQFNENWALDPKVLSHYAAHYQTGAPIPQDLVAKIKRAAAFNQGYATAELVESAQIDLDWHTLPANAPLQDVAALEAAALAKVAIPIVPPRYRSSYFQHIWGSEYAAGYYAYAWTRMLADDSFEWFQRHGGLTRANGRRFRNLILSRGHSLDYRPMFRAFYGKDPEIGPMLRKRGLARASPRAQ